MLIHFLFLTEEGRLLLITVGIDHGQDLVTIAQDAIDIDNGVVVAKDSFSLLFLILDFQASNAS